MTRRTFCKLFAAAATAIALPPLPPIPAAPRPETIEMDGIRRLLGRPFQPGERMFYGARVDQVNSQTWIPPMAPGWRVESISVRPIEGHRALFQVSYVFTPAEN